MEMLFCYEPLGAGPVSKLIATFFKIGLVFFGGGFVLVPVLHNRLVTQLGWLKPQEFLDGVAISNLTPGPIAVLATFAGFHLAGTAGALAATVALFAPGIVLMLAISHQYGRFRDDHRAQRFLAGVNPAIAGLILSAALVLVACRLVRQQMVLGPPGLMPILSFRATESSTTRSAGVSTRRGSRLTLPTLVMASAMVATAVTTAMAVSATTVASGRDTVRCMPLTAVSPEGLPGTRTTLAEALSADLAVAEVPVAAEGTAVNRFDRKGSRNGSRSAQGHHADNSLRGV
jgi:chromate transporter